MKIKILKCHGSGNDFILVDEYSNNYNFTEEQRVILAKVLCARNKMIGADGLLFFQKSKTANARMRIFNADGSEPEMCGNGIRCIGRYASELWALDKFHIETIKADLYMEKEQDMYEGVKTFNVLIHNVSLHPNSLPLDTTNEEFVNKSLQGLSEDLKFTALSLGNPHIVSLIEKVDFNLLKTIGEKANNCKTLFPKGVNVSFFEYIKDNIIFVGTYERGVGLTNSCGTAMAASSIASCLLGKNSFDNWIEVYNKGGKVKCKPQKEKNTITVILSGNATYEFEGIVEFNFNESQKSQIASKTIYNQEIAIYTNFKKYSEVLK